ncbi:MAG: hypothetical protein RLZZ301_910 [Bacteroidota bacterium]
MKKSQNERILKSINYLFSAALFILVLASCKAPEALVDADQSDKLPKRKDKELIDRLDSLSHIEPRTFYSKLDVVFTDSTKEISFKTSIKIVADSAVNAIITYARIPIVNAMVTTDSICVVNKKDRCYSMASLDYLKDMFGVDFTYENLEEIILGKPLDYHIDQKYFVDNNPFIYSISTHKKKDRRKPDRKQRDDIIINYILSADSLRLEQTKITSVNDSTEVTVQYINRQLVSNFDIPLLVNVFITTPRKQLKLVLQYDRVEINEPQELIIVIPEAYEKCD